MENVGIHYETTTLKTAGSNRKVDRADCRASDQRDTASFECRMQKHLLTLDSSHSSNYTNVFRAHFTLVSQRVKYTQH